MKVLVVGDPYMPVSAYTEALATLDGLVDLSTMQIDQADGAPPVTVSERGLREYAGDPAAVARAVAGLPWVLRERRVIPASVEAGLRRLEEPQRRSAARRYVG